jgi:WD40 repeat protein
MWRLDPYTGELSFNVAESHRSVRMFNCVEFVHTPDTCGRAGYMDEWIVGGSSSGDFAAFMVKPSKKVGEGAPIASLVCTVPCCKGGVTTMARNPCDASAIVIGGDDCTVTSFLYDPNKSTWIDNEGFHTGAAVRGLAVSRDGREVMAATEDGRIVRHNCGRFNDEPYRLICASHGGPVTGVAFSPSTDEEFATCSDDGTVKVWNMNDFTVKTEMYVRGGVPTSVAFSFDAVISGWRDGKVRCHHANTGEVLWEIANAHTDGVTSLCLSNNKRFLVTGGEVSCAWWETCFPERTYLTICLRNRAICVFSCRIVHTQTHKSEE